MLCNGRVGKGLMNQTFEKLLQANGSKWNQRTKPDLSKVIMAKPQLKCLSLECKSIELFGLLLNFIPKMGSQKH